MKLVCIRNRDIDGSIPWTRNDVYYKLKVGKIYDGHFHTNDRGKWAYLDEFNHSFAAHWWFIPLDQWRENKLEQLGI
jgi:hypothetical protein